MPFSPLICVPFTFCSSVLMIHNALPLMLPHVVFNVLLHGVLGFCIFVLHFVQIFVMFI